MNICPLGSVSQWEERASGQWSVGARLGTTHDMAVNAALYFFPEAVRTFTKLLYSLGLGCEQR